MLAALLISTSNQCAPVDVMTKALQDQYHESLYSQGVESDTRIVMMFGNIKTGTWTAVIDDPSQGDMTCIVGSGDGLKILPQGDPA